ncbi:MAG: DUF1926 domain-containing protein [Candidatus Zixiibacteriota bacterium]|nr:MAG: DUF1926 domain-containing protein [candidate division Zixibacteria bacterium]
MSKFRLAFGIHNHQPVGNFEAVFEEAHQKAYLPFLKLLERFPEISVSLHQSGILWRWQKARHSEFFELVGRLVDAGRIELMTGGFYEPILTSIPERDIIGQIRMLSEYILSHFETEPRGLWLTERIWEPHLPKLLSQAGVSYLPVDDTHFIYAGFEHSQLTGPFITEAEGKTVTLLPIQKRLRYMLPFGEVEDVIAELRSQAERRPDGLAVYADDGEKFGVWPGTHGHCYEEEWLPRFFEAVQKNSDWLEIVPLKEAANSDAVGRAYLPSASYEEMLQWSLPATAFLEYENLESWMKDEGQWERYGRFVRGGHWRGFLVKYEESNLMHKKMLRVSRRLAEFEAANPNRLDETGKVRDRLYASQCNCPYWHGVFGGLYLPHIRQAVHSSLIEADSGLRQLLEDTGVTAEIADYDADGREEVVVATDRLSAVFRPGIGGMLVDLSLNQQNFCLTDTLMRRHEGYHQKLSIAVNPDASRSTASIHDRVIAKEEGLADLLVQDWHLKRCFVDHFLPPEADLPSVHTGRFEDMGDFTLEPFEFNWDAHSGRLTMRREGRLNCLEGPIPVRLTKTFCFDHDSDYVDVSYEIVGLSDTDAEVRFAVENNFNFLAGHAENRYLAVDGARTEPGYLDSIGQHQAARSLAMIDDFMSLGVALSSDRPAEIWHMPIYTVSLSEGGFEKVYQGTTLVHIFKIGISRRPWVMKLVLAAGARDSVLERIGITQTVNG